MAILVDEGSRVVIQGITGREAVSMTRECLDHGTSVVAGVTPGKGGGEVYGVPVYDTVREAVHRHRPDVAVVSVPARFALDAALEAVSHRIPLVVIVTERIPRRDVSVILGAARDAGIRVVGPNSLGIISPGKAKVGSVGGPPEDVRRAYRPGRVGVISRSGGMTTEIANLLTQSGIGQSTCVSVGGDPLVGSTLLDLYRLFDEDPETEAVVFFSEPGGSQELELARWFREGSPATPLAGFVAGRFADEMPGVRFGHAGAIVQPGGATTEGKIETLRAAGITVVDRLREIPEALSKHLSRSAWTGGPSLGLDSRGDPDGTLCRGETEPCGFQRGRSV